MNYKNEQVTESNVNYLYYNTLSVHNLCAQEVWEELAEQLMDEDGKQIAPMDIT